MSELLPPSVDSLASLAANAATPELAAQAVRTAYALGFFDAGVESMRKSIIHDERRTRDASTLPQ